MSKCYQAKHIQHIQKALLLMNLLLTKVISDVVGETGQKIIRAILAWERDGQILAQYCKHFASWLGLCLGTKISGGKAISAAATKNTNRAAQALKMAAVNLRASPLRRKILLTGH